MNKWKEGKEKRKKEMKSICVDFLSLLAHHLIALLVFIAELVGLYMHRFHFCAPLFGFGATLASTAVLDMLLSSWLVTSESSATLLIPLGFQFTTLSLFFYLRSYCFSKNCWFFSVSIAFSHWNASCLSPYTLPFVYLRSCGYLVSWL